MTENSKIWIEYTIHFCILEQLFLQPEIVIEAASTLNDLKFSYDFLLEICVSLNCAVYEVLMLIDLIS